MAVDKDKIKSDIKSLIQKTKANENVDDALEEFSDGLAEVIKEAVLSLEVKAPTGRIQVSGSATSQTNTAEIGFETE